MAESQPVSKIIVPVEIWQAQNYWPIKGWSSPLSGCAHYTCQLTPGGGSENFPDDLSPPPGWEWVDKWGLDMSNRYGQPDIEGWFYASTFDRLGEMLKTGTGTGIASKTSLVRKRRWVRTMVCVAEEFCEAIHHRIDEILQMRRNIENTLKEKEVALRSVKFYEENRSFVFSQSLHLATQGTLNTLSLLKDIGTKLKSMKQYLQERAMIEREHATRMEAVAHKYWAANQDSPVKKTHQRQPFQSQANDNHGYPTTPLKPTPNHSMNFLTPMSEGDGLQPSDSYELFFGKVFATAQTNSLWLQDFSNNLIVLVTTEIDQMLLEIQSVLKEARAAFRKNSDICRLSEAAIRNFLASVTIAYESVSQASMRDIADLSDELNALKGGVAFAPSHFAQVKVKGRAMMSSSSYGHSGTTNAAGGLTSLSSNGVAASGKRSSLVSGVDLVAAPRHYTLQGSHISHARDDIWLAVQRYKLAVRDSQEALCVLISESMDLELQHQIFANRVHYLFSGIVRSYCQEETQLYSTLHGLWHEMAKDTTDIINEVRAPFPIIQSPFAQLNMTLDDPSFFSPVAAGSDGHDGEDGAPEGGVLREEGLEEATRIDSDDDVDAVVRNRRQLALTGRVSPLPQIASTFSSPSKDDLANMAIGMGVFSFTFLYREPLPRAPGVVRSAHLLYTSTSAFLKSRNILFDAIWKTVYLVSTTDGYVHVLTRRKSDIPDRSFYLRESLINESPRDLHQEDQRLVFELSLSPHLSQSKTKAIFQEGLCFRCANAEDCQAWLDDLSKLTLSAGHVDETVEAEVKEAMLQSLPILRGETAKIDLELQKYEAQQQQYQQQQQQQQSTSSLLFGASPTQAQAASSSSSSSSVSPETTQDHDDGTSSVTASAAPMTQAEAPLDHDDVVDEDEDGLDLIDDADDNGDDNGDDAALAAGDNDEDADGESTTRAYALPSKRSGSSRQAGGSSAAAASIKSTRVAVVAPKSAAVPSTSYKKNDSSWRSTSTAATSTPPSMKPITAFGVAPVNTNLRPKQLIPMADKNVPLARKHSTLIAQYEQALQKEKEKVALRVNETKGRRLQDVEDMLPEMSSPVPAATSSSSLVTAGDAVANSQQSSQQPQSQEILTLEDGTLDDLIGGGGGGGAHNNDMSLVSESFDLGEEATVGAMAMHGGTLASASVDSGAGPAGNGVPTDGTAVASKKTRRLVKTLSQKFDVNAAYGS